MIKFLAALCVLSVTSVAHAQLSYPELKAVLSKNVKTLQRDVMLYHYGLRVGRGFVRGDEKIALYSSDHSLNGPVPLQSDQYDKYFMSMAQNYQREVGPEEWTFGRGGFYAAIDIAQSSYIVAEKEDPMFLLEIKLKKGTRYIDTSLNLGANEGELTYGIRTHDPRVLKALQELNVSTLTYNWLASSVPFCQKLTEKYLGHEERIAFLFISQEAIHSVELKSFYPKLTPEMLSPEVVQSYARLINMMDYMHRLIGELDYRGRTAHSFNEGIRSSLGYQAYQKAFGPYLKNQDQTLQMIKKQTFKCDPAFAASEFDLH